MDAGWGEQSQPTAKRRKTKLACEACRERKVRCDGGKPACSSCTRRKELCIYESPSTDLDPDYVKSLESRIRELERGRAPSESWPRSQRHTHQLSAEDQVDVQSSPVALPNESHLAAAQLMYFRQVGYDEGDREPSHRTGSVSTTLPQPLPSGNNSSLLRRPSESLSEQRHLSPSCNGQFNTLPQVQATPNMLEAEQERYALAAEDHEEIHTEMQPGSAMGAADGTPTESGRVVFLGRSSAAAFMKEVQETSGSRGPGFPGEDATSSAPSKASALKRKKDQEAVNALLESFILPPRRVTDSHLANYWELVHPLYPVLHRPTFMQR